MYKHLAVDRPFSLFAVLLAATLLIPAAGGASDHSLPSTPDPNASYLFFLHNWYVEQYGPDKDCRYADILTALSKNGWIVVSEIRPSGAEVPKWAEHTAGQVERLLAAGVPAGNIVVSGHSKGAMIVLATAGLLENPDIRYVLLAGCGIGKGSAPYPDFGRLKGRFFSEIADTDTVAEPCVKYFDKSGEGCSFKETIFKNSAGHKLFFAPESLWVDPIFTWLASE